VPLALNSSEYMTIRTQKAPILGIGRSEPVSFWGCPAADLLQKLPWRRRAKLVECLGLLSA
jgi:hypothetical protein